MSNCENCFSPYMDERKKIIFDGKEFCDINCFVRSKYFDFDELDRVKDMQTEIDEVQADFQKSEDEKATALACNKQMIKALDELLEKYDDMFETGNKELDEILLKITEIKEDGTV